MKIKKNWVLVIIAILLVLFWFTHRNPYIAVRTAVFSKGYFSIGVNSKVKSTGEGLYTITPPPIEMNTNSELKTYRVNKNWIFYFAEYHGEV